MVTQTHLKGEQLKHFLLDIIDKIDDQTTVEDVFKQIAMLEDIFIAEQQIEKGDAISQKDLEKRLSSASRIC